MSFLFALQFLTVIPIPAAMQPTEEKKLSTAVVCFPLIGLLIGLVLWGVNNLLYTLNLPPFSVNIILVILLICLTGGIHLDGVSDSCDAFLSGKDKEDTLKIMRDPHVGAMGVLGLISVILLKIAFLYSFEAGAKNTALLLMCALSRWSLVLSIFLFPYALIQGKAKVFFAGTNLRVFLLSLLITLIISGMILKWLGLLIVFLVVIFTLIINTAVKRRLGGLTGDTLGAVCELNELIVLLSLIVCKKCF